MPAAVAAVCAYGAAVLGLASQLSRHSDDFMASTCVLEFSLNSDDFYEISCFSHLSSNLGWFSWGAPSKTPPRNSWDLNSKFFSLLHVLHVFRLTLDSARFFGDVT